MSLKGKTFKRFKMLMELHLNAMLKIGQQLSPNATIKCFEVFKISTQLIHIDTECFGFSITNWLLLGSHNHHL